MKPKFDEDHAAINQHFCNENEHNAFMREVPLVEKMLIERALARTNGNVSEAARQLGITRMAMRYRLEKYNGNQ